MHNLLIEKYYFFNVYLSSFKYMNRYILLIILAVPVYQLPSFAGFHFCFGAGVRSGTLFKPYDIINNGRVEGTEYTKGLNIAGEYFFTSDSSYFSFGGGYAYGYAMKNFHRQEGDIAHNATISENCLRADILIHPFNVSSEGSLYLGCGPSWASNTIRLETYQQGGGGGGVIFVGNNPWNVWLNQIPPGDVIPGKILSTRESQYGWHLRLGARFSSFLLEIIHEQAMDSKKEMGGTYLMIGFGA